ncbi:MAG TPA: SpoIVB peptidase S55 domain-containing protein [Gaiellales bacterium]|nr:SpoIVB peptidase S55 domain-containing protein [Gaiellales bacterium]
MGRVRAALGAVLAVLGCIAAGVALAGSHAPSASAAGSTCVNPPAVYPEDQVHAGLLGTGKTVVSGTTPSSFNVKVLGVLTDGIAPGLDLIVVQLSGTVMNQTGGAFEGISGSPVYVNGKLLGAVSYTFGEDNTIAGLTPAAPMMKLFGYPSGGGTAAATAPAMPKRIALPTSLQRTVDSAAGTSTGTTMQLLKLPVGVSGLSDTGLQRLQRFFDRHGLAYTAFRGGSAAAPNGVSGPPIQAGSNFAATQSFGDLTFYGLGTATAVCGNQIVAFGHPFFLTGGTSLGMNNASTITILKDPYYPFKLANITGFQGLVDQDRLAGIRGMTGEMPALTGVKSTISNADLGSSRTGETDVADQTQMALIAQYALYVENVVGFDREGSGSETMNWTITGTYQGEPFTLTRDDIATDQYDINYMAGWELTGELGAITSGLYGPVQVTGVQFNGTVTQADLTGTITKVESKTRVQRSWGVRRVVAVQPGGRVHLRVNLTRPDGSSTQILLIVQAPRHFREIPLVLRGGEPPRGCPYCSYGEPFRGAPKTFAGLLNMFQNGERSSDLITAFGRSTVAVTPTEDVVFGHKLLYLVPAR